MDKSYVTNLLLRFFTFETENILIRNCPISLKFGVFFDLKRNNIINPFKCQKLLCPCTYLMEKSKLMSC